MNHIKANRNCEILISTASTLNSETKQIFHYLILIITPYLVTLIRFETIDSLVFFATQYANYTYPLFIMWYVEDGMKFFIMFILIRELGGYLRFNLHFINCL